MLLLRAGLCLVAGLSGAGMWAGETKVDGSADVPRAWSASSGRVDATVDPDLTGWWRLFQDGTLESLVDRALASNLDIRVARERVIEALELRKANRSRILPTIEASGSYSRSRLSENGAMGRAVPRQALPLESDLFKGGLLAGWELDLFGRNRSLIAASKADQARVEAEQVAVGVSVAAEVALSYLEWRRWTQELAVVRRRLALEQELLRFSQVRLAAGLTTDLEVSVAEGRVGGVGSVVPQLEAGVARSEHRLGLLLGEAPRSEWLGAQLGRAAGGTLLDPIPARVPVGLPSELLLRRPDLQAAQKAVIAAGFRSKAAAAELFPRFFLTGTAGLESVSAGDFLTGGSRAWSLGPGLSWPVFSAGRLTAERRAANARERQAMAAYEKVVLGAFAEVEDALVDFGREQDRRSALNLVVASSRRSVALGVDRQRAGVASAVEVLEAQRVLLEAEQRLLENEFGITSGLVRLYRALGGGWDTRAGLASVR